MDTLNEAFLRELTKGVPATLVTDLICAKLKDKGVVLSPRQKQSLREQVLAERYDSIKISSWRFWSKQHVDIELTDDDIETVEGVLNRLIEHLPELITGLSDEIADDILATLKRGWSKQSRLERRDARGFGERLNRRWRQPLGLLDLLLAIARELGGDINNRLRGDTAVAPYKSEVLTRLHARACQVTAEIAALLRHGFADGALARWRTLHEIAVMAFFIGDGDDELAERYLLHNAIESERAAKEYQRYHTRLGYEPMTSGEMESLRRQTNALVKRFGPDYRTPYGWAAKRLGVTSPNFAEIERAVQVDHLRPFYRLASHNVHANPKGVLFKLGLLDETELLLAGPSDIGLADPGQSTALSLVQVTSTLTGIDTTFDELVALKVMQKIATEAMDSFVAVEQEMQSVEANER